MVLATPWQDGKIIDYYNSGSAILANQIIVINDFVVIAAAAIASLATGSVETEGSYYFPATSGATFSVGDHVHWDAGSGVVTATKGANPYVGTVIEAKISGTTEVLVKLGRPVVDTDTGFLGDLDDLDTTEQGTIVGAINELLAAIGAVGDLDTTEKTELVAAVNELLTTIGDVTTLTTTEQAEIVGAINELVTAIGTIGSLNTTATDLVAAVNELLTTIGDVTTLTTTEQAEIVGAINELVTAIGTIGSLNTTATDLVAAVNELLTTIGDVTTLTTTEQAEIVGAINELVTAIGTIGSLNTTATDLVAAINEILILTTSIDNSQLDADIKIGSLAALTTTSKATVQGAINELDAARKAEISSSSTITLGAATTSQSATIQLKDAAGANIEAVQKIEVYMATDSAGATPSGAGCNGNAVVSEGSTLKANTAKLHWDLVTDATGKVVITFDNTGGGGVYTDRVVLVLPNNKVKVSSALAVLTA